MPAAAAVRRPHGAARDRQLAAWRESARRGRHRAQRESRYRRRRSLPVPARRRHGRDHAAVLPLQPLARAARSRAASACAATARCAPGPSRSRDGSSRSIARVSAADTEPSDRLTPVYPSTEGLYQQTLRQHRGARAGARSSARRSRTISHLSSARARLHGAAVAVAGRCPALSAFAAARGR